jgi:integrase
VPAKGDGISKRRDGRYVGRYTVHTPDGPKRKYIYGRKYKEVEKKLAEARGDAARGIVFDAENITLGQWLERWLEDVVKSGKAHRTYATHRQQIRSHIVPALGRIKLEALRKVHIDRLYTDLLRAKPEGAGLAPPSVRRVHAVLHAALEEAVRGDLIPRNPAAHANKPRVRQKEIEPFDAKQAVALLETARGDRYEALYVLCLTAGLRQGEALGLKWSDVDLDAGTLRINRQLQRMRRDGDKSGSLAFSEPKNASRRAVGLPPRAVRALREHRKRQLEEKVRAGSEWQGSDLVFSNFKGKPLEAQNVVNRSFKPLLERAELPPIRFHDLRHSCLSLLASRGEPIRDLQALAGHATASFTLQRYTHHYDSSAKRTAESMAEIFPDDP